MQSKNNLPRQLAQQSDILKNSGRQAELQIKMHGDFLYFIEKHTEF